MDGDVRIGTSGWRYPPWRGVFYPLKLPHRRELEYLSRQLNAVEINGTFYSLQQLPPNLGFDADRLADFFHRLPRTTCEAAWLARHHDERMKGRELIDARVDRRLRHAIEVRHQSFVTPTFTDLLRAHDIALVIADTAGRWPLIREATSDLVYLRLHGDVELYTSGYTDEALDQWAAAIPTWTAEGRDVQVHFDNDVKIRAPFDALSLAERVRRGSSLRTAK